MATTNYTLTPDAWTNVGATPLNIQLTNKGSATGADLVVNSIAPTDLMAAALTLRWDGERSMAITLTGQNVYARADGLSGTTVVAVAT